MVISALEGGEYYMFIKPLTKDADKLICLMYKIYLERRKRKIIKDEASYFGDAEKIQKDIIPDWLVEDVVTTCWELHRKDLLFCHPGDNSANDVSLTNDGVVYMENRFANGLSDVVDFLTKFVP